MTKETEAKESSTKELKLRRLLKEARDSGTSPSRYADIVFESAATLNGVDVNELKREAMGAMSKDLKGYAKDSPVLAGIIIGIEIGQQAVGKYEIKNTGLIQTMALAKATIQKLSEACAGISV
jgi:hypothetical protein